MLIEAIRCLGLPAEIAQYTYYGFGGPYLEEFRLLHESFPDMKMVSIEENSETYKRQRFHIPCGHIRLKRTDFKSFLARYDSRGKKSIFWLDYIGLEYSQFEDFMSLLEMAAEGSIIKITLRANPQDYMEDKDQQEFGKKFGAILPSSDVTVPQNFEAFTALVQDMLQIAAQQALSSGTGFVYQPISSFCYKDGVGICTITGIVCRRSELGNIRPLFAGLKFANLDWVKPRRIDVPFLSTKERLHLQKHLPCD